MITLTLQRKLKKEAVPSWAVASFTEITYRYSKWNICTSYFHQTCAWGCVRSSMAYLSVQFAWWCPAEKSCWLCSKTTGSWWGCNEPHEDWASAGGTLWSRTQLHTGNTEKLCPNNFTWLYLTWLYFQGTCLTTTHSVHLRTVQFFPVWPVRVQSHW